jgi:hypothetical protein
LRKVMSSSAKQRQPQSQPQPQLRLELPPILKCGQCGQKPKKSATLKICGACGLEAYCDAACQSKAWSDHKATCKLHRAAKKELDAARETEAAALSAKDKGVGSGNDSSLEDIQFPRTFSLPGITTFGFHFFFNANFTIGYNSDGTNTSQLKKNHPDFCYDLNRKQMTCACVSMCGGVMGDTHTHTHDHTRTRANPSPQ